MERHRRVRSDGRAGRRGRRTGVLQTPEIHGGPYRPFRPPLAAARRAGLRAFRRLRRMQVAEHALRRTAPLQAGAGRRATETHRRNRAARDRPDQGLAADAVLPQQTGIHFQRPALADARGDRRAGRAGAGTGPRLPYSGTVRQGARHPQMLAAARSVERDPAGSPRILHRPGLLVLRYPRASGTDAQPDRAHRVDGRGDGDRRVRGRRPRAHRRAAEPHEGALSRTGIADVGRQHETQRHDRRSGNPPAQRARPYFRRDGKPAFQGTR